MTTAKHAARALVIAVALGGVAEAAQEQSAAAKGYPNPPIRLILFLR